MCLPAFAPIGAALLGTTGTTAAAGTLAAAVGTTSVLSPMASGLLGFAAQSGQAKAQAQMQRRASIAENTRQAQQVSAMRQQQATESLRLAQEASRANRVSMEAMARKQVAAGEAGISAESASYLAEMRDLQRQVAEHNYVLNQNRYLSEQAYELQARDIGLASQQNLININRPINKPDFISTMLGSATQSIQSYGYGIDLKTRQTI